MTLETRLTLCSCGEAVEWQAPAGRFLSLAPPCGDCGLADRRRELEMADAKRWEENIRLCLPAGLRQATLSELGNTFTPLADWRPSRAIQGLGIVGPSGAGKTWAVAWLLDRIRMPFRWHTATGLRELWLSGAPQDKERFRRVVTIPLLVIDDVHQADMTAGWSAAFLDLLNARHDSERVTLWTSQVGGRGLVTRLAKSDGEQAAAIWRRLTDRSLVWEV